MKTLLFLGVVLGSLTLFSQETQVIQPGPDSRIIETTEQVVNDLGETNSIAHRHTEISTGMNYWTGNEWKKSNPVFRLVPGAAIADEVQHRFTISHNINQEGAIVMETPDGKVFRSTPLVLAFRNIETGESVAIGQIQDSQGVLIAPNQVLFPNAMAGVACSIRYSVLNSGIEQEILFQEPIRIEDFGFETSESPKIRLEMWTGFYASPDLQKVTAMDAGEMQDLMLDFGAVQIGQGKTFAIEAKAPDAAVAKRFGPIDGDTRLFLVEMVTDASLRPLMNALEQARVGKPAEKIKRLAKNKSKNDADLVATYAKTKRNSKKDTAMMSRSERSLGPAVSLDYSTVNGSKNSFTFAADTTYYVNGNTTFSSGSLVVFEGGTVIKSTNDVKLTLNCPVTFSGSPYRPVVLTAVSDHSVGQKLNTATLSGQYASAALELNATTAGADAILRNFSIRHAQVGIILNGRTGHQIDHGTFLNCGYGVKMLGSSSTLLRNILFSNTTTNLSGSGCTVRAEHVTSETASYFMSDLGNCYLTNSLLAGVTTVGTLTSSQNVQSPSTTNGIFAVAVSGLHYLADNTYRNQGIAGVSILSDIKKMTTFPPLVLTSSFTTDTVLGPQAQRDTDLPDLGAHYQCLDYCWSNLNLSATLLLTNGVAIGVYGDSGLNLQSGAKLISQGKPDCLNRFVKVNSVQEGTTMYGTNTGVYYGLMEMTNTPATRPEVSLRFTELSLMADGANERRFILLSGTSQAFTPTFMTFRDCAVNGKLLWFPNATGFTFGLTNNVFTRPDLGATDGTTGVSPMTVNFRNNLFINGTITLSHATNTTWSVYDNVFDTVNLTKTGSAAIGNSNNGYKGTTVLSGSSGGDIPLTTLDWQTGPLGTFYYNTTVSATNTGKLLNAGSTSNAGNVGLYHYTTRTDQTKEGSGVLDIGFHYVATTGSTSTVPLDTDSDGVFDVQEDLNGSGTVNSGETDWQSGFDMGARIRITKPTTASNLP